MVLIARHMSGYCRILHVIMPSCVPMNKAIDGIKAHSISCISIMFSGSFLPIITVRFNFISISNLIWGLYFLRYSHLTNHLSYISFGKNVQKFGVWKRYPEASINRVLLIVSCFQKNHAISMAIIFIHNFQCFEHLVSCFLARQLKPFSSLWLFHSNMLPPWTRNVRICTTGWKVSLEILRNRQFGQKAASAFGNISVYIHNLTQYVFCCLCFCWLSQIWT